MEEKKIEIRSVKDYPPMAVSLGSMRVNKTGNWRNVRPVIDYSKCIRCMICWKFCPEPSILIKPDDFLDEELRTSAKIHEVPVIDYEYCKGCGICSVECPKDAIELVREER